MAALGSLVVKLALEYAQYTQGLDRASQESLTFAQNAQKNFDAAKGAVGDFAMKGAGMLAGFVTAALTVDAAMQRFNAAVARADAVDNLAQRLGIARGELQELSHVAMLSDTSLEGLGAGAKKLSVLMAEAAGGSEEAQKKLKSIGVSAVDANGKLRSSSAVMADIADKFEGMEDGAGKTALAMAIFGKSGTDLIPMLNGGGAAIREASEEARAFGLVMSDEGVAAAAAFGDGMDKLSSIVDGVFTQIADSTLPVMASFLETMVESASTTDSMSAAAQRLNKDGTIRDWAIGAAKVLGFVMDAGQGVYRVFEIIGKTMGAAAAQAALVLSGDFRAAAEVGRAWASDIDDILNRELFSTKLNAKLAEIGKTVKDAQEGGKTSAPILASGGKDKDKEKLSDYQKMTAAINDRLTSIAAESTAEKTQTETQKAAIKILSQLRDGTAKLTDEEKRGLATSLETMLLADQANEKRKEEAKEREKLVEGRKSEIEALNKTVEAAEAEVENFGKLPSAITATTIAKLESAKASIKLTDETKDEIAHLDKLIEANTRLRDAQSSKERMDKEKEVADQAAKDWQATADKIEETLTDALMRGFENGKGFGENLRDTLVNMFKTMVLRPIIQGVVQNGTNAIFGGGGGGQSGSTSGINTLSNIASFIGKAYKGYQDGGITGAFSSVFSGGAGSLGSSIGGYVSSLGNAMGSSSISAFGSGMGMSGAQAGQAAAAYNSAGMTSTGSAISSGASWGAAANVVGMAYAGNVAGKALSNGFSAFGGSGNSTVNAGTAIGAVVGSIVPVIGTALGALVGGLIGGAVNRMFGHKPKEVTAFGVQGNFTGETFADGQSWQNWKQKGGWFRSDKSGTEMGVIDAELAKTLGEGFKAVKTSTKDFAETLGLDAASVTNYSKSIKLTLTKDEAANTKLLTEQFTAIANEMAAGLIPNLAEFAKEGEDAGTTLGRLAATTKTVNEWFRLMGKDAAAAFGASGLAAAKAKQRIIDLAGGVDNFVAQSSFFADNFLSDAERMAPLIESVNKTMTDLGQGSVKTKEQFASLVKGIDLSTEAGQNLYASLMSLAPAFLQVANYSAELEANLPKPVPGLPESTDPAAPAESLEVVKARRQMEIAIMRLSGDEIGAVAAERAIELAALDDSLKPMQERIWALQDAAKEEQFWAGQVDDARSKLTAAYDRESTALKDTIDRFGEFGKSLRAFRDSLLTGDMSTLSPEQKYQQTKARFDKTYSLALAGDPEAMAALESVSNEFLQASKDYNASSTAYAQDFNRVRDALGKAANAADAQVSIASRQLAALDRQVAGLIDINESVLSVVEAIGALKSAEAARAAVKAGTAGGGKADAAFVESLYGEYLGRKSDAPGLAFWTDAMKRGATPADVIAGFLNSDEYKTKKFAEGGIFTNGVVSQPTRFDMGEMGEAGPEAIVPLVRTSKGLGVRMVGAGAAGGTDAAVAAKLDAVLVELRAANVQRGAAAGAQMAKLDQVAEAVDATNRQLARA